jgi:hypothetical protein
MLRYLIVRISTQLANWEIAWRVSSVKSTTTIDETRDQLNAGLFLYVFSTGIFALQEADLAWQPRLPMILVDYRIRVPAVAAKVGMRF